jgi:hypothetical protein
MCQYISTQTHLLEHARHRDPHLQVGFNASRQQLSFACERAPESENSDVMRRTKLLGHYHIIRRLFMIKYSDVINLSL